MNDFEKHLNTQAVNLFSYLREFVQLRGRVIRSLEQFEKVIWLADIPQDERCFCIYKADQIESDVWIEISKPSFETVPPAPKQLAPWLHSDEIEDSSLDKPRLLERIPNPDIFEQDEQNESLLTYLELSDYSDVLSPLWEEYVESQWLPWAGADRKARRVQAIYSDFFSLYQLQQKLGEAYDVVIAIGLLLWKTPTGHIVKRHIITAQTNIIFEAHTGKLALGPAADGTNVRFETDMLEATEQPDARLQRELETQLAELGDSIQNESEIKKVLKPWINSLNKGDGQYIDSLSNESHLGVKPILQFAPAIILRKKSNRTILSTLNEIISQLQNGGKTPKGVQTLVTISNSTSIDSSIEGVKESSTLNNEIYFPLPANEEQKEIIRVFNRQQGVVVQGPPGTGKSHTIANLLCHLLATGNRVLVTSHTPRALKVLKEKIPDDISALCVQALGNDRASLQELENSVQGITEKHTRWNASAMANRIQMLQKELDEERRKQATLTQQLRAIRESDTYKHSNMFGDYSGTLQKIAQRLKAEEPFYKWLPDSPLEEQKPPLSNQEAIELYRLLSEIGQDQENLANIDSSIFSNFLLPEKFREIVVRERQAKGKFTQFAINRDNSSFKCLLKVSSAARHDLRENITKILRCHNQLQQSPVSWLKKVAEDILAGQFTPWQTLFQNTCSQLERAQKLIGAVRNITVEGIDSRNLQRTKNDASRLLHHLRDGRSFGFGPFRPKVVRECQYLTSNIFINGQPCNTANRLVLLIDYLAVYEIFVWLRKEWTHVHTVNQKASVTIQFAEHTNLQSALEEALSLSGHLTAAKNTVAAMPDFQPPYWHDIDSLSKLVKYLDAAESAFAYREAQQPLKRLGNQIQDLLKENGKHPVGMQFLQAVKSRDEALYAKNFRILEQIFQLKKRIERRNLLFDKLIEHAPILARTLRSNINNETIAQKLGHFTSAWNWARTSAWLKRVTDSQEQNKLNKEMMFCQKSIQKIIAELASLKAWEYSFQRMSDYERQHLISWKKAVEKIGKGTGKYANRYRREARDNMEKCRSAIPAWIMPIYRIAETIRPQNELFDVVIIDEASQSGPEALILQYYGKRIVVVGDNKQISPNFVGVNKEDVALLRRKYLQEIPHSEHLGVDNSFFDQAEIRYPNPIRLREHFRCMPEIIQFSNNNWYQSAPLIPLRQYTNSRLSPVLMQHLPSGYAEGESNKIVNKPEAEAIAEQIKKCCEDSKYQDKSIGVISLQGTTQAKYIEGLLLEIIGPEEIEKRKIVCGDAYAFQGDERDVVFLSMVAAPNKRTRAFTDITAQRRFNVAASRAKDQMWLFHSVTTNDLSPTCLRYKLLEYCQNPTIKPTEINGVDISSIRRLANSKDRSHHNLPGPFESWFEVDVFLRIVARGYRVIPQYKVAQFRIDMVVEGMQGGCLAVECDGDAWHGPEEYEKDAARERILTRCGWTFWRVRGGSFYRNPEEAMSSLWATLDELGIKSSVDDFHSSSSEYGQEVKKPNQEQLSNRKSHNLTLNDI